MPELASGISAAADGENKLATDNHRNASKPWRIFLLHIAGIFLGIAIMAAIAIYEEDLKSIFD